MDHRDHYFPVVSMGPEGPTGLLGTAFAIADGWMMSCRHVIDVQGDVAVHDTRTDEFLPVRQVLTDDTPPMRDLAVFECLADRALPLIGFTQSSTVRMGTSAWASGYISLSPIEYRVRPAFFSGRVTSVLLAQQSEAQRAEVVLPFAVVEGLSGTPLMIDSADGKMSGIAGVCCASRQQRTVAQEITDTTKGGEEYSETLWRVVELGSALHVQEVGGFLSSVGHQTLTAAGF